MSFDPPDTFADHCRECHQVACECCDGCNAPRAECGNCLTPGCPEQGAPHVLAMVKTVVAPCCEREAS